MSVPRGEPDVGVFVPERFCDEVYDCVDDSLAEAMDDMERELCEAPPKMGGEGAASGSTTASNEESAKTCCDNLQKCLQKNFDREIDIFDRYVKKNASAAIKVAAARSSSPQRPATASEGGGYSGAASSGGSAGADAGAAQAATTPADGVGGKGGLVSAVTEVEPQDAWILEVSEETPPKRLKQEEEVDAKIQRQRNRRREGLRRYTAMVRKGAREAAVLQDAGDCVKALQEGVSSSFDYNGLTPVPAKVQEAVQSCAELRATSDRAQDLTRRVERHVQGSTKSGSSLAGGSSGGSGAAAAPPAPRDLQAMFQRSSEQQVVAGSAADYSALETRLRG